MLGIPPGKANFAYFVTIEDDTAKQIYYTIESSVWKESVHICMAESIGGKGMDKAVFFSTMEQTLCKVYGEPPEAIVKPELEFCPVVIREDTL